MKSVTSYVIVAKTNRILIECDTRKKARRQARKTLREEYMVKNTVIIVTGESIKEALASYKIKMTPKPASKKAAPKTKKVKKSKTAAKVSMRDELFADEDKKLKRLNKRKQKATPPVFTKLKKARK